MIDLFERLPGLIWALITAHPMVAVALGAIGISVIYVGVLKAYFACEDLRAIRNRKRNR